MRRADRGQAGTYSVNRRRFLGALGVGAAATLPSGAAVASATTRETSFPARTANAEGSEPITWRSTMGTHYRIDAVDEWLGILRGLPFHAEVGFNPDVADLDHDGIEPTIGRFSGKERFYDFTGVVTGVDYVAGVHELVEHGLDVVWHTGQAAIDSTNDRNRRNAEILRDDPERLMDCLHAMVTHFNTGEFADLPITIYWQIGNEVTSSARFATTPGRPPRDERNAVDYAEYYLRPATVAVQTASREIYNDPHRVRLMAGSASGIQKEDSRQFLAAMLNHRYELPGRRPGHRHIASLSGQRVWQTIDLFSIHYANGECPVVHEIYDDYIATGKMRGFYNTEELGNRGRGDYNTVLVGLRHLDFWIQRDWHRDTGRIMFWGDGTARHNRRRNRWGVDQSGREGQALLGTFLRDFPLTRSKLTEVQVNSGADVEWYALRGDAPDGERRQLVYVKPIHSAISSLNTVVFAEETPTALSNLEVFLVHAKDPITPYEDYVTETGADGELVVRFDHELDLNESFVLRASFES